MQIEDFNWFVENHKRLYQKYGDCYLAIKNKCVLGVYSNTPEAVRATLETEQKGTFIVQKVTESSDCYTAYVASEQIVVM